MDVEDSILFGACPVMAGASVFTLLVFTGFIVMFALICSLVALVGIGFMQLIIISRRRADS